MEPFKKFVVVEISLKHYSNFKHHLNFLETALKFFRLRKSSLVMDKRIDKDKQTKWVTTSLLELLNAAKNVRGLIWIKKLKVREGVKNIQRGGVPQMIVVIS